MYPEHKTCLICNSSDLRVMNRYSRDFLVKCRNCSFVFSRRIPSQEELIHHYDTYIRGTSISPITVKRYNELLDEFEKYRIENNILDIGCGDGYFLEEAKKRGWNVYGTEFTDEAIEVCRKKGIHIFQGKLNPSDFSDLKFDVITSFEVIEHINNPQEELQNINSLLRSGGLFFFTTPNFNSLSRFILGPSWSIIEYPEHLSYYTPSTINRLMIDQNLNKIYITTTGISLSRFRRGISGKPDDLNYHRNEEELREKTETKFLFRLLKNLINTFLKITKTGDTIKGTYQKK